MESSRRCILPWIGLAAVLTWGVAPLDLRAAGDGILVKFESVLGTTPLLQGWVHEGRCIGPENEPSPDGCPDVVNSIPCWYQGSRDLNYDGFPDNSCLPGVGCRKSFEHYNSPDPQWLGSRCTYTEWIAFDDGDNSGGVRPLIIPDSTIPHSPPWGAPFFLNAPSHPALRVVTGDGNHRSSTMPVYDQSNFRNAGKAKIRKDFSVSAGVSAVTLLINAAAGPRSGAHEFVEVRVLGYRFSFGVDGNSTSPNYGKLTVVDAPTGTVTGTLFNRTVLVAQPGAPGPHAGEFFLLRVILKSDGSYEAYLNDSTDHHASGQVTATGTGAAEIQLTPDNNDATMWFDFVKILEGEWPVSCPSPPVDHNRDGQVDQDDFDAFLQCSNGPGVPTEAGFVCSCFDSDDDGDVDATDYAVFQRCLTTTGVLDPSCAD